MGAQELVLGPPLEGLLEEEGRLLVAAGPLLGVSRLVLGVHWPSDIVAGWAFGSAALCVGALLLLRPLDRGWVRPPPPAAAFTRSG